MRAAALMVGLWGGGAQAAPFTAGVERVPEGLRVHWPSGGEVGVLSCRGATPTLAPDEVRFTCTPASPLPDVRLGADVSLRWR